MSLSVRTRRRRRSAAESIGKGTRPVPHVRPGMGRVVEKVFDEELWDEYDRLVSELRIEEAASPETIREALNRSERNALDAHRLFVQARVSFQRLEHDSEVYLGAMRRHALNALQDEKDKGKRGKQITDADIRARMAETHPDEWSAIHERQSKAKGTVDTLARLADLWQQRSWSLSGMMGGRRRHG